MTWSTIGELLAIAYLPGALIFRMPVADRDHRASLPVEERAFWAVLISLSLSSAVVLALAAAGGYTFDRLVWIDLLVCLAVAIAGHRRLRYGIEARRPTWTLLIPVALVGSGLWLYNPPAEYVIGGKDPGTYMNEGIQIAQRGSLVISDPVVAAVPPPSRDLFFPSHDNPTYYGTRFMGFFLLDPEAGTVVGQFPHLFPSWIAIGYGLNGLSGARQAVVAWAVLGLLATYFVGARLLGRTAAAAGAALLAVNVIEIWFARYPNSEVVMQALLLAGLLAYARAHIDGDRFFGPVAGVLLGALPFLRFDGVIALAGVGVAMALGLINGHRPRLSFLGALLITLTAAAVYLAQMMAPYAAYPLAFARNLQPAHLGLLVIGGVGLLGLALLARRPRLGEPLRDAIPIGVAIVVLVGAAYGYFWRSVGGRLALHDAEALRTFASYYVSPATLFAAVLGYVLIARRAFWQAPALLVTTAAFAFFFFYKIRIVPDHFWMARRFLPIILPMTLLLAVGSGFHLLSAGPRNLERPWPLRLAGPMLGLAFAAAMGWHYWSVSLPVRNHVEYAGIIPQLERLAERFGDDDLVLVESRAASDMHVLALPLAYIYARNVLVLNTPRPNRQRFGEFLAWADTRYDEIFFLGGGGTDLLSRSIAVSAQGSDRFQVPEYHAPRNRYPEGVRHKEFDFGVYRFVEPRPDAAWFSLDVGTMDDLHVVRFHAKEVMEPYTFRWSRDVSYVSIQGIREDSQIVVLCLNDGGRPDGIEPAHVTVSLNDRLLGQASVSEGFRPYTFAMPADLAAAAASDDEPARLMIVTNTWNPGDVLGVPDDRQLGVMVDRVEVQ